MPNDIIPIFGNGGIIEDNDWIPLDTSQQPKAIQSFTTFFRGRMTVFFAGMHDRRKPIFVGLLAGSSGVGKTLTAQTMAGYLFGSPDAMTKVACAEYQEPHKIAALIGSPPGYVGFWDPSDRNGDRGAEPILSQKNIDRHGFQAQRSLVSNNDPKDFDKKKKLLEKEAKEIEAKIEAFFNEDDAGRKGKKGKKNEITEEDVEKLSQRYDEIQRELSEFVYDPRKGYYSVILFDEIEKANESLHRLLLEIMDTGHLTLSNGMTTSFRNSFIFLTSNAGSEDIGDVLQDKSLGFKKTQTVSDTDKKVYESAMRGIKERFPPEFMGRIGKNIIIFRPLSREFLDEIFDLQNSQFQHELILTSHVPIIIRIDKTLKDFVIIKALKHSELGARRMIAFFEQYVKEPIAKLMAGDSIRAGDILKIAIQTMPNDKAKTLIERARRPDENRENSSSDNPDDEAID